MIAIATTLLCAATARVSLECPRGAAPGYIVTVGDVSGPLADRTLRIAAKAESLLHPLGLANVGVAKVYAAASAFLVHVSRDDAERISRGGGVVGVEANCVRGLAPPRPSTVGTRRSLQETQETCEAQQGAVTDSAFWNIAHVADASSWTFAANGADVRLYVVDTGVMRHQEFYVSSTNTTSRVVDGYPVTDAITSEASGNQTLYYAPRGIIPVGGQSVLDDGTSISWNDHGTHCAGTAAGLHAGLARSATIVPVAALSDTGTGTTVSLVEAIEWAINDTIMEGKPAVFSLSLGSFDGISYENSSQALDNAIVAATQENIVVAVAAGNTNIDARFLSPANIEAAVTVGATQNSDDETWYSSASGPYVDIWAPGVNILSASVDTVDSYVCKDGTSMATPHLAGAAAAVRSWQSAYTATDTEFTLACMATSTVQDTSQGALESSADVGHGIALRLRDPALATELDCSTLPQSPSPPPPTDYSTYLCTNDCLTIAPLYSGGTGCNDGGPGALYAACSYGTDCDRCGARDPYSTHEICFTAAQEFGEGLCTDGGAGSESSTLPYGFDCADCGPRPNLVPPSTPKPPPSPHPPPSPPSPPSSGGDDIALIIGLAVGGSAALGIAIAFFFFRRRNTSNVYQGTTSNASQGTTSNASQGTTNYAAIPLQLPVLLFPSK